MHPNGPGTRAAIISLNLQLLESDVAQTHHVRSMLMICSHEATLQIKRVADSGIGEKAQVLETQSGMCNKRLY
jgi:hypothetical protein